MTLGDLLRARATQHPHKTALYCGGETISYEALDASSTRLAQWFHSQGLEEGDRLAIQWPNSIPAVQLIFASFKAGLIVVPINLRLKPAEIGYILEHSQAAMCFSEPTFAPLAEQARAGSTWSRPILTELPALPALGADASPLPEVGVDRPAVILYTSGTTAHPKGVTHTHRSLIETAKLFAQGMLDSDDIVLAMTQLAHATGLNCTLLPAIYLGASAALLPAFEPAAVLDAIQRFRCTYTLGLPALLQFLVEEQAARPRDVSSLRRLLAGGDTVPVSLQTRFQGLFGLTLQEAYGMTESVAITKNPRHANLQGSIGIVQEGFEVRLVDLDDRDVEEGETGELVVRSLANCAGYWNDPEATAALMRGGWLHTGDLASRDRDGYYWFRGRIKQIIIRGGSNISPQEVEEALYQHPAVLEVGVVGAPHPVYGEIVVAFVALRGSGEADEAQLRDYARQSLADYKVPERILFIPQLPKGPTGKVQRRELKEMLLEQPALLARRDSAQA